MIPYMLVYSGFVHIIASTIHKTMYILWFTYSLATFFAKKVDKNMGSNPYTLM
jgi:hypothetical protein